tara:strand:+ start:2416 stop:2628 length:213 start_codon:yes stop_codon:yes gene_type:complete
MENDNQIKVNDLESEIKKLEKAKIEIQESCDHKESKVKFVDNTNTMKLFCVTCNKSIGYPSKEEIEKFLK